MGYEVIKEIAKQKGMNVKILAEKSGLTYNNLSKIIRNTINGPRLPTMISIAHALDMSVDDLLLAIDAEPSSLQETDVIDPAIKKENPPPWNKEAAEKEILDAIMKLPEDRRNIMIKILHSLAGE